jgi:hypothetical protein
MSYHAHTTTPYQYLYEVEGSNYSVPDDIRTSFRPRVDKSSLSKTLVIVEEYAYNMATPQSKDGYITIPSLVSLKVCSRFERPSSPQYSGSASETRPRYRKSCTTSSIKGIRHLSHSRRVEDGHPTRSSSATTARICSNIARILSTCCRRVYSGCLHRGVSLSLKASASKRRRVAQMYAVVRVVVLMAAHSGGVAADAAVFLYRYTQY